MPTFHFRELETLVTAIFEKAGAPLGHAQVVASHLVESNLAGHDSHGVMRVSQYIEAIQSGQLAAAAQPRTIQESTSGAVLDGQASFGQVAAQAAMKLAIGKASKTGIGAVTLRNCFHSGRLAAHSELAVHEDMIGIVMVNGGGGGQSVAPFGGSRPRLATNPISIAAPPADPFPLVLDIATSMAPEGKIRDYLQREQPLPEGWIVDSEGRPSTDPQDLYEPPGGAIQPLGGSIGYKGFGLALMIDVLAGALSGAGTCSEDIVPASDGILVMALDIAQYGAVDNFHRHVLRLIEHVKSCPAAPGFEEVHVPGELEYRSAKQKRQSGVPLPAIIWDQISAIAADFKITERAHPIVNGSPPRPPSSNENVQVVNPI